MYMTAYARVLSRIIKATCFVLVVLGFLYIGMALITFFGTLLNHSITVSLVAAFDAYMPLVTLPVATALSPMGGTLHMDYLFMGVLMILLEWPLSRLGDAVVNGVAQR